MHVAFDCLATRLTPCVTRRKKLRKRTKNESEGLIYLPVLRATGVFSPVRVFLRRDDSSDSSDDERDKKKKKKDKKEKKKKKKKANRMDRFIHRCCLPDLTPQILLKHRTKKIRRKRNQRKRKTEVLLDIAKWGLALVGLTVLRMKMETRRSIVVSQDPTHASTYLD